MTKKKKGKKILIMGLPGAGKTFLAKKIYKDLKAVWINADVVRRRYKDWDFSKKGRTRQAQRLNKLSNRYIYKGKNVIVDFICPTQDSFKNFKADFVVWVDTIKKGRHIRKKQLDINKIFKKPKKFDLRVTSQDAEIWKIIILDILKKNKWDNQKPTAQMLGRFQPWHEGHKKLFENIVKKDLQVNIQIKDVQGINDKNPFSFSKIKNMIQKDLKYFNSRIKITKAPNITNIFLGRKVGYKINKILTPSKYRNISGTNIRKQLKKLNKL
jgi:adenylate kinase family enzyme